MDAVACCNVVTVRVSRFVEGMALTDAATSHAILRAVVSKALLAGKSRTVAVVYSSAAAALLDNAALQISVPALPRLAIQQTLPVVRSMTVAAAHFNVEAVQQRAIVRRINV